MKKKHIIVALAGICGLLTACGGSESKDSAGVAEKPHIEEQIRDTDDALQRALNLAVTTRERVESASSAEEVETIMQECRDDFEALGLSQEQLQELSGNQEYIAAQHALSEAADSRTKEFNAEKL